MTGHLLRPQEIENIFNLLISRKPTSQLAGIGKEDFLFDCDDLKHIFPSTPDGHSLSPQVLKTLRMVFELVLLNKKEKKAGRDNSLNLEEITDQLKQIFQKKGQNSKELDLAHTLIMAAIKENEQGNNINLKRFCELILKAANDPNDLTKAEKKELSDELKKLNVLRPFFSRLKEAKQTEDNDQKLDPKERSMQIGIWEGGVLIDIIEGVFANESKAYRLLSGILSLEGCDENELALEDMGILKKHTENLVTPSVGDLPIPKCH